MYVQMPSSVVTKLQFNSNQQCIHWVVSTAASIHVIGRQSTKIVTNFWTRGTKIVTNFEVEAQKLLLVAGEHVLVLNKRPIRFARYSVNTSEQRMISTRFLWVRKAHSTGNVAAGWEISLVEEDLLAVATVRWQFRSQLAATSSVAVCNCIPSVGARNSKTLLSAAAQTVSLQRMNYSH